MYLVIFKAIVNSLDDDYSTMAQQLRDLAINSYNCVEFNAVTEGSNEIALSYWHSLEDIKQWKQDKLHLKAQELGKAKWYRDYSVEITQVLRSYKSI
ncbi:MAG: antibiotic biosynthesis monooxygenase [Gammaproteobacteria bacterium]|nr:antibiotic biosynthesis monooxygenase [Gammaproteobacteria bacterium]